MIKSVIGGLVIAAAVSAQAEGIHLQCDAYSVVVETGELVVNGRRYSQPQEQPYALSEGYSGRALMFTDGTDRNSETNWVALHIITQLESGKKAFFYADGQHKDEKAIICNREEAGSANPPAVKHPPAAGAD